jgi:hypothetical protein
MKIRGQVKPPASPKPRSEALRPHHEARAIGRMTKSRRGRAELACSNAESQETCDHDDDDDDADDVENIH